MALNNINQVDEIKYVDVNTINLYLEHSYVKYITFTKCKLQNKEYLENKGILKFSYNIDNETIEIEVLPLAPYAFNSLSLLFIDSDVRGIVYICDICGSEYDEQKTFNNIYELYDILSNPINIPYDQYEGNENEYEHYEFDFADEPHTEFIYKFWDIIYTCVVENVNNKPKDEYPITIKLNPTLTKCGEIYQLINTETDDFYIGKTSRKNPEYRFKEHKNRAVNIKNCSKLYTKMREIGIDKWKCETLEIVYGDLLELTKREEFWITKMQALTKGLNSC